MVVFISRYHKGFHISNDTKVIQRYLPQEVGELVVQYLWLILPFVEILQAYQWQQRGVAPKPRRLEYIWGPDAGSEKEWTGIQFQKALESVTAAGLHG